ncbi:MAG TPA: acylphosphatase [Candidatus Limnocylindrales bacterium]|nr:acylphosphatase [Candidatus Limnocylindrales bacterium]
MGWDVGARRLEAVVHGRVQGVGYRLFVVDAAIGLGLVGWVANEPGGTVRTVVEGPEPRLLELLRQLREGPSAARVDAVDEAWSQPTGAFDRFSVRSGWHAGD